MIGYQIRQVSEMLGVPRNTLIAWERRYQIVEPVRTPAGYRVYTEEHLAVLKRVKALIDEGFRVGDACRMVKAELAEQAATREVAATTGEVAPDATMVEVREQLLDHLLGFHRDAADAVSSRLLMVPFERAMEDVYLPLLREVGARWVNGDVTVVQEHFVTAWCREKLTVMLHTVRSAPRGAPEVVCATPPGEHHELGLLSFAIRLAIRGFRVLYLGTNVPTSDLVDHVSARRPYALALSVVQGRPPAELASYARDLRRRIPDAVRIAIGGRAVSEAGTVPGVVFCEDALPSWMERASTVSNQVAGK